MASSEPIDSGMLQELQSLMKEFPEWKDSFPDMYKTISQPESSRRNVNDHNAYNNQRESDLNQNTRSRRVVFDDETRQYATPNAPSYSRYAVPPRGGAPIGNRVSTTKDHYKWWNPDPSPPFCELPTFSNYLIYPGRGRTFQTTTQAFFKGEPGFRPPMCKPRDDESMEILGLTSRGRPSVDTHTTTGLAFQSYANARPAEKIDRTPHDTRYLTRYVDSADGQQVSTLNNRTASWRTVVNNSSNVPKFDGMTVSRETYQPWPITQRQPYGDQHEAPFAPTKSPFDGRTTNSLTYRGQQLPAQGNDRIQPAGLTSRPVGAPTPQRSLLEVPDPHPRMFDTAYRTDFDRPNPLQLLSKSQAAMLLRDLRERKRKRDAAAAAVEVAVSESTKTSTTKGKVSKQTRRKTGGVAVPAF